MDIRNLILHGRFHEAYALLSGRSKTEIRDDLLQLGFDDESLKEHLLLFHEIPEKLVTSEEARKVAEEIISVCPESTAAKMILGL